MDTQDRRHIASEKEDIAEVSSGRPVIDTFGLLIFFVVVVEIILIVGLNLYQNSRIKTLSGQLDATKTTLAQPENATINSEVSQVLDGSDQLKAVLSHKVHWAKFYTLLNGVTPKNVKVTTMSITETGTFRAEGSTDSLTDLAQLLVAWRTGATNIPTPFSSVDLNNNGFSDAGGNRVVSFSVSGQVNMEGLQ